MTDKELLEEGLLREAADFFKALGNDTRLQVIWCLSQGEKSSGQLAEALEMTPSAISHQLTLLKQLKIVKVKKEGKTRLYQLADDHISRIMQAVLEHYQED